MQFLLVVAEIFHLKGNVLPRILSVVLDILIINLLNMVQAQEILIDALTKGNLMHTLHSDFIRAEFAPPGGLTALQENA